MISALQKQENGTITLTITIPSSDILKTQTEVLSELAKEASFPGFRKGKAPVKMVEEKLGEEKIREEVLKKLLPQSYIKAVEEHKLRPIMNPKIHITKVEEGKDWQFTAQTCEAPTIDLTGYKDAVQKITAKSKIIMPGKTPEEPKFEDIMKAILETIKATIPQILVETEADRLLSHTLDDVKKIGLTLDQYLASTNRTPESLRSEYEIKARNDITLEFALQKIAEEEKITVEEKELDEAILAAKNPAEKENLEKNRYMLAQILRQQKTLDFLKHL